MKIGESTNADFEWFNHELTESNYEVENKTTYYIYRLTILLKKNLKAIHGMKSILNKRSKNMRFTKKEEVYRISRITGSQDNILGVSFAKNEENNIELIEWPIRKGDQIKNSAEKVLKQVLAGLKLKNEAFKTNYRLSKIYFLPSESPQDGVYTLLIAKLISHYHTGGKFEDI